MFVVFEGIDGAGKSTLIKMLSETIRQNGQAFVITREPGGTTLGEEIRNLLIRTDGEAPVARAELFLYEAGRAQHVEKVIRPALARKEWVLCDRFTPSTVAFQSHGRGLDVSVIETLNRLAIDGVEPDVVVLLDLNVEESRRRRQGRLQMDDRFEQEKDEFHQRVRQSYLQQAKAQPKKWIVLDASLSPDKLLQILREQLRKQYGANL